MTWLRSTPSFRLRAGYLAAMGLVAIAVLASFLARDASMDQMESDASLVNIAGRQRMLSQRIAAKATVLVHSTRIGDRVGAEEAATELRRARDLWASSQASLVAHYATGRESKGSESAPEIAALFARMAPAHEAVLAGTTEILERHARGDDWRPRNGGVRPAEVAGAADRYLPVMNEAVGAIEARANGKLAAHARTQLIYLAVTLLVIVLTCVLVFEPLVRWHRVLTERLRDAAAAAEEGSRAKSAFLANMSHEIRTPMTAIIGYSKLMADDPDTDREQLTEWSRTVEKNARSLLDLINDILDVSKIEAGRMAVECVEADPAVIVEEVVSLLRLQAVNKGVALGAAYDSALPDRIETDPVRLRQVLLNLAGNALKFTGEGSVTIRAACEPGIERLVFRVEDTGVGLTPEQLDKIRRFEAFTQADSTTTRRFGGTGLGLKLSKTFLDLMGGTLEIESIRGTGSAFTVSIPTGSLAARRFSVPEGVAGRGSSRSADGVTARESLAGVRILLAEDGPDNRRLFERFLTSAGADFRCVTNGAEAVDAVTDGDEWRPHLILMDMQMPVLDGYGAARRLRTLGVRIPVVALTAHAMAADRQACLDAGCDDYLSKPVDRQTLVARCAEWGRRSRREAA
jgi:signal transduction histidine kinase/ActR/RegA family two-component response regulator